MLVDPERRVFGVGFGRRVFSVGFGRRVFGVESGEPRRRDCHRVAASPGRFDPPAR